MGIESEGLAACQGNGDCQVCGTFASGFLYFGPEASESQQRAVAAANRSLKLANARYSGGIVTYLDVITAQEQALTAERLAAQLFGQRMVTSVYLVKALGGGWNSASLAAMGIKPRLKQAVQQ